MKEKLEAIEKELIGKAMSRMDKQKAELRMEGNTIERERDAYMDGVTDAMKAVAALANGEEDKNVKRIPIVRTRWEFMKQMKPESVAAMMDGNYGDHYPWCELCDKSKDDDCDGKCRETILKWLNKPLEVC